MVQPEQLIINGTSRFPGNTLPVLHYRHAIELPALFRSHRVKKIFSRHDWGNIWRSGIHTYNHYHSNTHEAIAVIKGHTVLLLGGEYGTQIVLQKGDLIVIPAGVAHKNLGKMRDVICIGGYPGGHGFDMNIGDLGERPKADTNISTLELPMQGPLYGKEDPLILIWNNAIKNKIEKDWNSKLMTNKPMAQLNKITEKKEAVQQSHSLDEQKDK